MRWIIILIRGLIFLFGWQGTAAWAGTLTMETNVLGPTPEVVGYDSGHFDKNSNTADWWRYSGVSGARLFISPTQIEPSDELPPWGDGVTNQASFEARKALVRSDPWNTNYFNWPYVTNRYATYLLTGSDQILVDYACSQWQRLGIPVLVQSTATASKFASMDSWADKWELWHFYYEQAFYLGLEYGVERYQMYNEPNTVSPALTDYMARLQTASDAVQCAIADLNTMYGLSLTAKMYAPVTAGSATSTWSSWGEDVVTNRHVNDLGATDSAFEVIQDYDYHQYGGSPPNPSSFGSDLASLEGALEGAMAPERPFPVSISEFNVYDGSEFHSLSTSLDTPLNYSALGSIALNLIENGIDEIYCFKFSQTTGSGYIAKNGTHYVDNTDAPYNIGGVTKGGEVWRLVNKGLAPGRSRLGFQADNGASTLDAQASYDPASGNYHLLVVNNTTNGQSLTVNFGAWNIPINNQVLLEEVSESCYGAGKLWTTLGAAESLTATEGSNSVWLFTVPSRPQQPMQTMTETDMAQVNDGADSGSNEAGTARPVVADNSTNASERSVIFLKFNISGFTPTNTQLAVLSLNAASASNADTALAYLYGITNNAWSQTNITWVTAPNLAQGMAPGTNIANDFVDGSGVSAELLGEVVAGPSAGQKFVDVTAFLKQAAGRSVSFMLVRQVRFPGDVQDNDGLEILSAPQLQVAQNALPPVFSSIQLTAANSVALRLTGTPGQVYWVQAATNLFSPAWTTVSTDAAGGDGTWVYDESLATNATEKFYRAVLP